MIPQFNEKDLISRLSNPSTQRQAFTDLVRQYTESLYWKIRHIVVYHDDANDVLQNVFIKAWNNLDKFEGKSKLSTWLYRIAVNESLDFLRRQKASSSLSENDAKPLMDKLMADEYFNGDEVQAKLQVAIASLPDVQRTVFNMRYYDDMKYSEMSKILGTSEGALKASYHLAVKKVTEFFDSHN